MFKDILKLFLCVFFIFYFLFHIINGEYGILSYNDVNNALINKRNILNKKQRYVSNQKDKIKKLKLEEIDIDLLDEKLKENVGIMNYNEILIFTNDLKNI